MCGCIERRWCLCPGSAAHLCDIPPYLTSVTYLCDTLLPHPQPHLYALTLYPFVPLSFLYLLFRGLETYSVHLSICPGPFPVLTPHLLLLWRRPHVTRETSCHSNRQVDSWAHKDLLNSSCQDCSGDCWEPTACWHFVQARIPSEYLESSSQGTLLLACPVLCQDLSLRVEGGQRSVCLMAEKTLHLVNLLLSEGSSEASRLADLRGSGLPRAPVGHPLLIAL